MKKDITVIKSFGPAGEGNIFGGQKKSVNAFNSEKNFCDNSVFVGQDAKQASLQRVQELIAQTQLNLNERC